MEVSEILLREAQTMRTESGVSRGHQQRAAVPAGSGYVQEAEELGSSPPGDRELQAGWGGWHAAGQRRCGGT